MKPRVPVTITYSLRWFWWFWGSWAVWVIVWILWPDKAIWAIAAQYIPFGLRWAWEHEKANKDR